MKKSQYVIKSLILLSLFLGISCEDKSEKPDATKTLVDFSISGRRSADNIQSLIQIFKNQVDLDIPLDKILYAVDIYKIEYTTKYKGRTITASGLVMIPDTQVPLSTISFHHGTIAADREAPTNLLFDNPQLVLLSALASTGTIVTIPDFIGFGSSVEITHPYYNELYSAVPMVDLLYAASEIAKQFNANQTSDLYLAGYSQGGYVTMATHKYIEENGISNYELRASFPSSGGYDLLGVRDFFFEQETYDQPFFLAYVAESFRTVNDWEVAALNDVFQAQYASQIPTFFDGSKSGSQINALLTDRIADLVHPAYLANPEDLKFKRFQDEFIANSLIDWVPTIPMHMYHGDADITVPFQNSVSAHAQLLSNGASPTSVTFTTLPGADHFTGFLPYIELVVAEYLTLEGK